MNRAIEIDGQSADLYVARGELHASIGQRDSAETDFTQAIQIDCRCDRAFLQRGLLFTAQGKFDDAIRDFTAAIQTGGPSALTHLRRGETYVQTQKFTKAVRDFEAAIQLEPGLVQAHTSRAVTLARQGEYHKAIIELSKALGRFNNDEALANLLQCRAKIYYNIGRFHQSIDDCTSIIQLDPAGHNFSHTLFGRGLALLQLGANEEAERNFSKAAQLDPQLKVADSALKWLRDPSTERPAALQPPENKVPPKRPPAARNPLQVGNRSGKWGTDSLHDQWVVLINDQHEYGPVTKKTLDKWCAEGRLDGKTLLLRIDWDQWRWASDVYQESTAETASETQEAEADEPGETVPLKTGDDGASPPIEDEFPEIELK